MNLNKITANKSIFDWILKKGVRLSQSVDQKKPDSPCDDCSDKQTHLHKTEDTSGSHNGKSH